MERLKAKTVFKIYILLRNNIGFNMNKFRDKNKLGKKIENEGYLSIEVDEIEIIGNNSLII